MTKLFLIVAAVLTVAAGPVSARETATTTAPAAQPATTPVAQAARPNQRYCVQYTLTGSRVPYTTCQTRAEWLAEGFDPLNPKK